MPVIHRSDDKIDEDALTKEEVEIFIVFLQHERERHLDDVQDIDRTINKLKTKRGIR